MASPNAKLFCPLKRSRVRLRWGIPSLRGCVGKAASAPPYARGQASLAFPAGCHGVGLWRRLPVWRSNRALPARPKPHGARALANQSQGVGFGSFCSVGAASHQIDAIANSPRLLEIESVRRSFHIALEILDSLVHHQPTRGRTFGAIAPLRLYPISGRAMLSTIGYPPIRAALRDPSICQVIAKRGQAGDVAFHPTVCCSTS